MTTSLALADRTGVRRRIKEATPHPPGLGSRIGSLERCLLEPGWGLLGSKLGVLEVQVGGLGGLLGSMLDLVGHKQGFGRSSGYMEGVWKGLGWLGGGWGPGSGSNMGPT